MNCLILGGNGFIGSHIAEQLLKQGHQVTIYERPDSLLENVEHIKKQLSFIYGDFKEEFRFPEILQNIDWVFHLICTTLPANENAIIDIEENVIPTLRLLEACRYANIRKILFISSGGTVYGASSLPVDELHKTDPICAYGIQKLMIEKYLHLFNHLYSLDYTVLRVSNPYGERQNPFKPQGAIGVFLAQALLRRTIKIWGDGNVVRDFLHVSDVAIAAVKATEYKGQEKLFNIGSGVGCTINDVLACMETALDRKIDRVYLQGRKQDVAYNVLDSSRAKSVLGWEPVVDMLAGIRRMAYVWRTRFDS